MAFYIFWVSKNVRKDVKMYNNIERRPDKVKYTCMSVDTSVI